MYKGVPSPRRCANPKPSHLHHTATNTPGDLLGSLTPERGSWNPGGGHRSRRAAGGRDIGRGCRLRRPSPETPEGGGVRNGHTRETSQHGREGYTHKCILLYIMRVPKCLLQAKRARARVNARVPCSSTTCVHLAILLHLNEPRCCTQDTEPHGTRHYKTFPGAHPTVRRTM